MEQFSKGEECISHFQKKEKIRRIAFFLLFSFLFSIHGRIMRNPYTKKRNNRLLMRNIGQKVSKITRNSREIRWHACTQKKKPKKNIEKTGEKEREERKERRRGKNWREKKLNVSPSAYKHDRSSGFSVSVLIPAWHTPYGIVFISGRPFCVLLRPFVNGRNRPVLHFTCRVCHAALLDRKEDRQKSGIVGQANYNDNWKSISIDSGESPSR